MKEIRLTQNKTALVDNEDYEWLNRWKWYARKHRRTYYASRTGRVSDGVKNGVQIQMHREILNTPVGMDSDHKDRDGLNNQRFNLRVCTNQQNQMNRRIQINKLSNYKGVTADDFDNWIARIQHKAKSYYLGYFNSEVAAARAYDKRALELYGEFASLNF